MHRRRNVLLSTLTTMRIGGPARSVVVVESADELPRMISSCRAGDEPFFVIGGGSNLIARDQPYPGVILLNRIKGFEVIAEDGDATTLRIAAGEVWDEAVARAVEMNLSGIEALSAIPGTAGATPVQNVGAYGQEIADTLVELEALDTRTLQPVTLRRADCGFAYRYSRFKNPQRRHHIITSITLKLRRGWMKPPFYPSLQAHLERQGITDFSPAQIRRAVIAIRREKLPDPALVANSGSFFKNPIVEANLAESLARAHPDMPRFAAPGGRVKLAAGWLIEQAGLKGYANHHFMTSPANALVVINRSHGTHADLERFKAELAGRVFERFGVRLEQEPETL